MGYYKFLNSNDVKFIAQNGSIRFRRARYYQLLELQSKNQWIGDKSESSKTNLIREMVIKSDTPEHVRDTLKKLGGPTILGSGTATFSNMRSISYVDCLVSCFSHGSFEQLQDEMAKPRPGLQGYHGCVEIKSMDALIDALKQFGRFNGKPFQETFRFESGPIKYTPISENIVDETNTVEYGNPFIKNDIYINQMEYRLALFPIKEESPQVECVDFVIPKPQEYFSDISFGVDNNCSELQSDTKILSNNMVHILDQLNRHRQEDSATTVEYQKKLTREDRDRVTIDTEWDRHRHDFEIRMQPVVQELLRAYWDLRILGYVYDDLDQAFLHEKTSFFISVECSRYLRDVFRIATNPLDRALLARQHSAPREEA